LRTLQWAAGLAILWFAGRSLLRNWHDLEAQPLAWRMDPLKLVLAAVTVWGMYALLVTAWRVMLTAWGERLDGWTAGRIWTVSNLGKYLPGKVWAIAGMALMARQEGVSPGAATGSAVILQAVSIGSGAVVAALTGAAALERARPGAVGGLWLIAGAAIAGVALLFWPACSAAAPARGPSPARTAASDPLVLASVTAWVVQGALWLLAAGCCQRRAPAAQGHRGVHRVVSGRFLASIPAGQAPRGGLFILMRRDAGISAATALALASAYC
jgi:hypothetical protein